ncbi:MAG: FKBP-type peptidyl-prolyl cis-trans isomerase [Vicinamibacterales bacterium]
MSRPAAAFLLILVVAAGCRLKEEPSTLIPPPPDVAAPPPDAIRTSSGLASKMLQIGFSNVRPTSRSRVRVNYTGWTPDGKMFDSSVPTGQPVEFGVDEVIPGWKEGLQLMVVGEKRRFWIPGALAYGEPDKSSAVAPRPGEQPKGTLVFDIELLRVTN